MVFILITGAFLVWSLNPLAPMQEARASLDDVKEIVVTSGGWLAFQPRGKQPETGFIFYPGGRVDYRAYAPLAQEIAGRGYLVVIVPMPFNLAVFAPDRADEVVEAYPQVRRWVTGGHSLGGAMAAQYAVKNPGQVSGLVLLAAYPAESGSLASAELPVLSISAEQDGLATPEKIDASRTLLPADTQFVAIPGGNHAQFGWYGAQDGDGQALISREEQQNQTVAAIAAFLAALEGR